MEFTLINLLIVFRFKRRRSKEVPIIWHGQLYIVFVWCLAHATVFTVAYNVGCF